MSTFNSQLRPGQSYFSANKLTPEEVAAFFVESPHLEKLVSRDNVILTGPRGSGKTTLMKMLTRQALDEWNHEYAKRLLKMPILSIYFGSDVVTRALLLQAEESIDSSSGADFSTVRRAKLGYEVLLTILHSVRHELDQQRASIDVDAEEKSIASLTKVFRLAVPYNSLAALTGSAEDAVQDLSAAISRALDGSSVLLSEAANHFTLPALPDLIRAVRSNVLRCVRGLPSKWILLFDEVEYLHPSSRQELLSLVRMLGNEFGLKIALTPLSVTGRFVPEFQRAYMHAGHEYEPLSLGFIETRDIERFASTFTNAMLAGSMEFEGNLQELFGLSRFHVRHGGPRGRSLDEVRLTFEELGHEQARFSDWCQKTRVLDRLDSEYEQESFRASLVRRPWPMALLWRELLVSRPDGSDALRSRKLHSRPIYAGLPSFLLLADGNPRAMLRMLASLLARHEVSPSGTNRPVFPSEWQDEARESALKFQIALANAYLSRHGTVFGDMFAIDLIGAIGATFQRRAFGSPRFIPDPAFSFSITEELSAPIANSLVDAVYTGALVDISSDGDPLRLGTSLVGRRFRLSYLLASRYWLPLRRGKMLAWPTIARDIANTGSDNQLDLSLVDGPRDPLTKTPVMHLAVDGSEA